MKRVIFNGIFVLAFGFASQIAQAQENTYLSNLGLAPTGSNPVGSDSWLAAGVYTGSNANGYLLNSVQLAITDASGNPNSFAVMIYANDGNHGGENPGIRLGTLSGSLNPATSGIYTYTPASNITLLPSTQYYIVLTAGATIVNGAYHWSFTSTSSYQPGDSWVASVTLSSSDGSSSSWTRLGSYPLYDFSQFSLNATPVPEPSAWFLIIFSSGLLIYARNHFRHTASSRWRKKVAISRTPTRAR